MNIPMLNASAAILAAEQAAKTLTNDLQVQNGIRSEQQNQIHKRPHVTHKGGLGPFGPDYAVVKKQYLEAFLHMLALHFLIVPDIDDASGDRADSSAVKPPEEGNASSVRGKVERMRHEQHGSIT